MAADIDFPRHGRLFRCMAQPEFTEGLGWMLGQTVEPAASVMISSDQLDLTSAERRQFAEEISQSLRQPQRGMNEVSKNDQAVWLPAFTEIQQGIERPRVGITGERHAMSLKCFGFSEMKISNHEDSALLAPQGSLWQKGQPLLFPVPGIRGHRSLR